MRRVGAVGESEKSSAFEVVGHWFSGTYRWDEPQRIGSGGGQLRMRERFHSRDLFDRLMAATSPTSVVGATAVVLTEVRRGKSGLPDHNGDHCQRLRGAFRTPPIGSEEGVETESAVPMAELPLLHRWDDEDPDSTMGSTKGFASLKHHPSRIGRGTLCGPQRE